MGVWGGALRHLLPRLARNEEDSGVGDDAKREREILSNSDGDAGRPDMEASDGANGQMGAGKLPGQNKNGKRNHEHRGACGNMAGVSPRKGPPKMEADQGAGGSDPLDHAPLQVEGAHRDKMGNGFLEAKWISS